MKNKIKTNKSIADRIKVTKTWKFLHRKAWRSHLLKNKKWSNRNEPYGKELSLLESVKIKALIPYKLR